MLEAIDGATDIVYEYQRVDDWLMWRVATKYFPELRDTVTAILRALDKQD